MKKVILISIDGMRPDGLLQCGHPFVREMMRRGTYTLEGKSVFPSVTLPCHMSLFHSIPPERHGIMSNSYTPMVRPVRGLFEQISLFGGNCAMYYGWEPLRDVSRPESQRFAGYVHSYSAPSSDSELTDMALERIARDKPDFVFLYMVETDQKGGHDHGWMTPEYLAIIHTAIGNVQRVMEAAGDEYVVMVTADHGGHDRDHGSELKEDMTIPMFFFGDMFEAGKELEGIALLDLAPTIADVMSIPSVPEWEGRSILDRAK